MDRIGVSDIRNNFADVIGRVLYRGERLIVHRRNRDVVAIVPLEDLEVLQTLEERLEAEEIREVLKEVEENGAIPWEEVKRELGLK